MKELEVDQYQPLETDQKNILIMVERRPWAHVVALENVQFLILQKTVKPFKRKPTYVYINHTRGRE